MKFSRRKALKGLALSGASLPLLGHLPTQFDKELPNDLVILFQGDSITDGGRNRNRTEANDSGGMGGGYVKQIATELLGLHPDKNLQILNRGISGNKVHQLAARWETDCLSLRPDVLSILIGVNDYWHTLSNNYKGTPSIYNADLRRLLDRTINTFPDLTLIIGEPFVLLEGTSIDQSKWAGGFPEYRNISRSIAKDYNAMFIPYQEIFDKALNRADTSYWCPDGVHPSLAGNYLMATSWSNAFYSFYE